MHKQDYSLFREQKSAFMGDLDRRDCFEKIKLIGSGFDRELVADMTITKVF